MTPTPGKSPRPVPAAGLLLLPLLLAPAAGCFGSTDPTTPHLPAATPASPTPDDPEPPRIRIQRHLDNLDKPIQVTHAGDGSGRLFVAEQTGRIWTYREDGSEKTLFLNVSHLTRAGGERGLLGIAFHPRFEENGHVYVSYTDHGGDTVLARYETQPGGLTADPRSATLILFQKQPYSNHNGGLPLFGPDGYLYFGLGDGGSGGDPQGHGQNRKSLLGKLLRLDVDTPQGYAIPPTNPYADGADGAPEVWAYGLRNPWRYSFDRETGDLYIGDVGQNKQEEINYQPAASRGGENYGWNLYEGNDKYRHLGATPANLVFPITTYDHSDEGGCSVTGGHVYRGHDIPGLQGTYLFGDYCSGAVWSLQGIDGKWERTRLLETGLSITSFGEDERGELYLVHHGGEIYRFQNADEPRDAGIPTTGTP